MYIRSYETKRFAGLKDAEFQFRDGLNVILGPNESGKSSLIEGIHASLFKNIRLRRNNNADKDFTFKFMPRPHGDSIDGQVVLATSDGDYKISRQWGSKEGISLETPAGNIIRDEGDVEEELGEILSFGESTYSNIVFAKQRDLKKAIFNIIEDDTISKEINDVLRQALMELDGVSIDSIESNIDEQIDSLYKRWDIEKNYPENNRGINHPYKVGLGKIIESYYYKEELKLRMKQASDAELEFEGISEDIRQLQSEEERLRLEKEDLEKIEADVNTRGVLEAELASLNKSVADLMEANKNWPMTENQLEAFDGKIKKLQNKKKDLLEEKKEIDRTRRRTILEDKLEKIRDVNEEIEEVEGKLESLGSISQEDIEDLEKIRNRRLTIKTSMEAGKMIVQLKEGPAQDLYISKDLDSEEIKIAKGEEVEANGYLKINYKDKFQLEVKTGELDFESLAEEYKKLEVSYREGLEGLAIENLEEGKLKLEELRSETNKLNMLKSQLETILAGEDLEDLNKELESLISTRPTRDLEEIEEEERALSTEEVNLLSEKKTKEEQIARWTREYEDFDKLLDLLVDRRLDLRLKSEELESLSLLPEEFSSPDEFRARLSYLRKEVDGIQRDLSNLRSDYYEARSNLSDETYQELKKESIQAERSFERLVNRGEKLLKIKRVFTKTKENMEEDPMESLVIEFERLLDILTDGDYTSGTIEEDFQIRLEDGSLPIELLSAGTHDAVTLALRFALLKHIFQDGGGYVLLDDVLVDLDPKRKEQSVNLIREFSKDYQIIFTTCDPDTAEMLGGNFINI